MHEAAPVINVFFCSVNHALLINYTAKRNINVIIVINISILYTAN